ncbi:hypothetical protein AM500_12530 [Bacillus sp. FJAT-18017]|uniref:hypothetical protein n=1 Tax=Bacillus sp. FJAT-18017 TaxID=1705566 RepID=UPI0006ADFDA7|nr:hypothetical protein [Bacillus sp. FJAT-18017]ALC90519.1 hypothetical protein AM500_12530 [Bacillus sp. FJAT-18017]
MEQLTGKDLLEKMGELPTFEMDERKRQETVMKIRQAQPPKQKWGMFPQKAGIWAALAAMFIIIPILYITEFTSQKQQGSTGNIDIEEKFGLSYFGLRDGKNGLVGMDTNYGISEKASIMGPKEWVANDYRGSSKVMVFIWGNSDELIGKKLTLTATHKETGEDLTLVDQPLAGKHFDADAHLLTSFPVFPTDGLWELEYTINGEQFANYPIYVYEPYIEFKKATLLLSQSKIFAGEYQDVPLELEGADLPSQVTVKIHNLKEDFSQEFNFKKEDEFIRATDGKVFTGYSGTVTFLKSGNYEIEALGNSGEFEVRIPGEQE